LRVYDIPIKEKLTKCQCDDEGVAGAAFSMEPTSLVKNDSKAAGHTEFGSYIDTHNLPFAVPRD
jgi:hypothetical protein